MKLLTRTLEKRFEKVGPQNETPDPLVLAKFFDPVGSATWYATEYDSENFIFYGYVTGLAYDEWGSFSLKELEAIKRPYATAIERDIYFKEQPVSEAVPELKPTIREAQLVKAREHKEKEPDHER